MTFAISAWNLINSMKQVDKWTQTIQGNINGTTRIGYKQFDIYYGGGPTNTLAQPSLANNGKSIAETSYSVANTQIDFSQGSLIDSDKWYHIAVDGEGFFMTTKSLNSVSPDDIQYTRDGEFHIDGDGFLRTKEGLYVLDGTTIPGDTNPQANSVPPWAGSIFNSWNKREGLLIKNNFADTLTADTVVELSLNTESLVNQTLLQADMDDLKIGYWDGTNWNEVRKEIIPGTENTPDTRVRFRLVDDVPANTNIVGKYYVFYGNPGATNAPAGPPFIGSAAPIGVIDPDGMLNDFSGISSPASDPLGTNSVEDWLNSSGPDSWLAGPLTSPSTSWAGFPAGDIDYTKGVGYKIEGSNLSTPPAPINVYKRKVIDGLSNYPVGAADGVGSVRPGGWQFIDKDGNEIVMKAIDGTNTVNSANVEYNFSVSKSDLNATESDLDPTKTKYESFKPTDVYTSPYKNELPDITAGNSTSYKESEAGWGTNPLSGTYSPYVSAPGVTLGDSNFDADDTIWSGSTGTPTVITEDFNGVGSKFTTEFGSLDVASFQYKNTLTAENTLNDSNSLLNSGTFDDFTMEVDLNKLSGAITDDFGGIQIRKTNQTDDFYQSGYTIMALEQNQIAIYKAGVGVVATASMSAYNSTNKKIKIEANGNNIKVSVDGTQLLNYTDAASTYMSGHIGFRTSNKDFMPTTYGVNENFTSDPFVNNVLENITGNLIHDPIAGNVVNHDGNGNNLKVNGNTTIPPGRINGSTSAYAPNSSSLSIGGTQITMEAWINPSSYPTDQSIIMNKESTYEMCIDNNGRLQIAVATNNLGGNYWFWTSNSGPSVPLNQWSHVVGTYDTATNQMKLYVNGVLQHTQSNWPGSTSIQTSNNQLTIGARDNNTDNPGYFFNGQIDEVRISDTVRYNANFTPPADDFVTDLHTRALYHFDDALGSTTLVDSSGNGNHLTGQKMLFDDFSTNPLGTTIFNQFGTTYDGVGAIQGGNVLAQITTKTYDDFILETKIENVTLGNSINWGGVQFRKTAIGDTTGYGVIIRENGELKLIRNTAAPLANFFLPAFTSADSDKMLRVVAKGANIKVYVDDILRINYTDPTPTLGAGLLAIRGSSNTAQFKYDNLMIFSADDSTLTSTNPSPVDASGIGIHSMATYEGGTYKDFVLETDMTFKKTSGNTADFAGIQFRKTNANDDYTSSGYFVYIRENGQLELNKNGTVLAVSSTAAFNPNDTKKIKIIANGANIKVLVDGVEQINYNDSTPITTDGYISYRTYGSIWAFDNLKIEDLKPGKAQWMIDDFNLTTIEKPNNNYQYLLLRQPIYVGNEGVIRDNNLVNLSGFVDQDVTIVIRDSTGAISKTIYTDGHDGYNNWSGSFDPYDDLKPGQNWIEIYASHEVASPPNVPPFADNGNSYTIGPAQAQMQANGWQIGGSNPSAWQITNNTGSPYIAAGAPAAYGNILYSTTNDDNYIYRGNSTWDDYSMTATVGVANTDDDMIMLWARVSAENVPSGPLSGYAFMIQRPADVNGVGYGNHQIALARFDNGVPTILANEHTDPALMNWFSSNVLASGTQWAQQHWNFKLEVEGPNISIYAGTRGTSTVPAGPVPLTPLVTVTDSTYPSGKFALKTISQVAWFDNISFQPSVDRKTGFKSDIDNVTGKGLADIAHLNEIQTIDAFQTIPRYYVDGSGNVVDRFGDGTNTSNQNIYMRSNITENLIDYDPNEAIGTIVDTIDDVPILNARLVQDNPNPGGEARIYTDTNSVAGSNGIQYLGSDNWNEYEVKLNFGLNQTNTNGKSYIYARYQNANNWIRVVYDDSTKSIKLEKSYNGTVTALSSSIPFNIPNADLLDEGGELTLRVEGRRYSLFNKVNNKLISVVDNTNPILNGSPAVGSDVGAWYDNIKVRQLLLSKVKSLGSGVVAPNGPEDILNQMYLMVFRDQGGQNGLGYDKELGSTYFEETQKSGRARALRPGVDGAGFIKTSNLETSNVDINKQITHLAAHSDVYDSLTKQLVVYLDTIQSSLSLFR